ncbi:Spc98 family-domain-containing protein [Boletus coccyginus]|nr:Spc98 family-domain-containing protein [Boletus coccyginus]
MIAEVLLVLAGHSSSLFTSDHNLHPAFRPLLHPGEEQCLQVLGQIALRYRNIKKACATLSRPGSRYVCALCATLNQILKDDYESLVVDTEAKILQRDPEFVGQGFFVPLACQWDAPLATLESLTAQLESQDQWQPWPTDRPAAHPFKDGCSMPSCVSHQSRESIIYVGRAIATVKKKKWESQIPREQALHHANLLGYQSVVSLANYFLLRNGEFSLALIQDIEHLKISRLTTRSGGTSMIREQDLNLALLRASLGTTAQHDPSLLHLKFQMPSGPVRPLLPSLSDKVLSSSTTSNPGEITTFDDLLLGSTLVLTYNVAWPLDLFLHPSDLQVYSALFNYLASLRKTHTRIHTCWTSLSNAQRARRRWTGLGEGGTIEDLEARKQLLRCGWGVVRDMGWFLDSLLGYVMVDVVDVEFRRFRELLNKPQRARSESVGQTGSKASQNAGGVDAEMNADRTYLDFTTLRNLHTTYLERLVTGCLLSHPTLAAILRPIFEVCERLVAQVERWGGDVLPALLFEGSLAAGDDKVGAMVHKRLQVISEINKSLHALLDSFYEELSLSTSQQPFTATGDASRSILMTSTGNQTMFQRTFVKGKGFEWNGEVRRHVERLLLRLDLNGSFSRRRSGGEDILC